MTIEEQIASLDDCLVEILNQYDLGAYKTESISHEFNSTFKVTDVSGEKFALRINVNSTRSLANLNGEIAWVDSIQSVTVPKPQSTRAGKFVANGWHDATGRTLNAVLYSWLDGEELGDEPRAEQLFALGATMAKLNLESVHFETPEGALLPDYSDVFWGAPDLLTSDSSTLTELEKKLISKLMAEVSRVLKELADSAAPRPIHADLHPWNSMWHKGQIAVFDFDDSGLGLPIQDLATALYYLDTDEQRAALVEGYQSAAQLPEHTSEQLQVLLLQRRVLLLNYLYETTNPEHIELIPEYQAETFRRLASWLSPN